MGQPKTDQLLDMIAKQGYKVLFLIDELDVVHQRETKEAITFREDINAMAQSNEHGAAR